MRIEIASLERGCRRRGKALWQQKAEQEEEERLRLEEEQRRAEEERLRAQEEARRQAEAEEHLRAQEERRRAEEAAELRRAEEAAEELRRAQEAEEELRRVEEEARPSKRSSCVICTSGWCDMHTMKPSSVAFAGMHAQSNGGSNLSRAPLSPHDYWRLRKLMPAAYTWGSCGS